MQRKYFLPTTAFSLECIINHATCACVYLWYASNVATFIADHFASFYVLCNKNRKKEIKIDVKCFMLVC